MNKDILKLDNQLCFRLYAVSRNMTRLYKPLLSKFNLTYPQYIVLLILFEHQSLDFKELSSIIDLKTGTLTPILQSLEEKGYIDKHHNKSDKRKIQVNLSTEGELLKTKIMSVPIDLYSKINISPEMYKVLVKELDDLSLILKHAEVREGERDE